MVWDEMNQETTLSYMIDIFKKAPEIYQPSLFWQKINAEHINQLQKEGYENFKRTLNLQYFNWSIIDPRDVQFRNLIGYWIAHPAFKVLGAEFRDQAPLKFSRLGRFFYKVFVSMLWEYTKSVDRENLLEKIEEPLEGNPFGIYYKNHLISQDLCNSILEYYSIMESGDLRIKDKLSIAELGAGYGRDAFVFVKTLNCKYVIFDIPPALYIAQRYLESIFPDLKAFEFRNFARYVEIKDEYENAELCFFTPNQLELLPKPQFNLFLNISSLHEMRIEQISKYFSLINEYTRGYFYMKQWLQSINPDDGVTISYNDYPVLPSWQLMFFRKHPIQSHFFEALYKI
jgi:putative sugar O-methyltransferase